MPSISVPRFLLLLTVALLLPLAVACQSPRHLYERAVELHRQEQYVAAIETYERVMQEYPRSDFADRARVKKEEAIDGLIGKGDQQMANEAYFQAVNFYESALQFRPDSPDVKRKLAKARQLANRNPAPVDRSGSDGQPPVIQQDIKIEVQEPARQQPAPVAPQNQPDRVDIRINENQSPAAPPPNRVDININEQGATPGTPTAPATPAGSPAGE